jgi:hypothetical protein
MGLGVIAIGSTDLSVPTRAAKGGIAPLPHKDSDYRCPRRVPRLICAVVYGGITGLSFPMRRNNSPIIALKKARKRLFLRFVLVFSSAYIYGTISGNFRRKVK